MSGSEFVGHASLRVPNEEGPAEAPPVFLRSAGYRLRFILSAPAAARRPIPARNKLPGSGAGSVGGSVAPMAGGSRLIIAGGSPNGSEAVPIAAGGSAAGSEATPIGAGGSAAGSEAVIVGGSAARSDATGDGLGDIIIIPGLGAVIG